MRKILVISSLAMLVLVALSSPLAASAFTADDLLGHNFSEAYFAEEFDFNFADWRSGKNYNLTEDSYVKKDLFDPNNPRLREDPDPVNNQQFFMAYANMSGIEVAYMALEEIATDIIVSTPLGTKNLGHLVAAAPFQSLLTHFESGGNDIFIANHFDAFVAYPTTSECLTMNGSSTKYLGYTFVLDGLLNAINQELTNRMYEPLGNYSYESFASMNADNSEFEFGITYRNMLVFWQEIEVEAQINLPGVSGSEGLITGKDIVAATNFDYITYTYKFSTTTDVNGTVTGSIETTYDLGPVNFLATTDSQAGYDEIVANVEGIDSTNSFCINEIRYGIEALNAEIVITKDICIYLDDAAKIRMDVAAVENYATGMGISVITSTNVFVCSYELGIYGTPTYDTLGNLINEPIATYPITVGDDTIFETEFEGKDTYTVHYPDGNQEFPISVAIIDEYDVFLKSQGIAKGYFALEKGMTYGFLLFFGMNVSPVLSGYLYESGYSPTKIEMTADKISYMTAVQMGKWSGYEITQDPTYSAVSAVKASETDEGEDTSGVKRTGLYSIPGFEFLTVIIAVPVILFIYRRRKQK